MVYKYKKDITLEMERDKIYDAYFISLARKKKEQGVLKC